MGILFNQTGTDIDLDGNNIFNIDEIGMNGTLDFTFDFSVITGAGVGTVIDFGGGQTYTIQTTDIASGTFVFAFSLAGLADGGFSINWTATDALSMPIGNGSTSTAIDQNAPAAPVVTGVSDDSAGTSATDGITNDNTLMIEGTAEANSVVEVYINGNSIGTVLADGSGAWSFDHTGTMLGDATYSVTANATDAAGNTGALSAAFSLTVDTTAPAAPTLDLDTASDSGMNTADEITNDDTPSLTIMAEAGSAVEIFDGTVSLGTADESLVTPGEFTFTSASLADGMHDLTAVATDAAGNSSVPSTILTVTVDTGLPADLTGNDSVTINEFTEDATPATFATGTGPVLATFAATDLGAAPTLTYSFGASADIGGAVELVGNQLLIVNPDYFDFEDNPITSIDIVITDGAGNVTTDVFTVTLNDLNDLAVVDPAALDQNGDISVALVEGADLGADDSTIATGGMAAGTFNFTDDEVNDTHQIGVTNISSDASGGFVGVFLAGLSNQAAGGGTVDWTFGAFDAADQLVIDALAVGDVIRQVYTVTITDSQGGVTEQTVSLTIAGANDAPVVGIADVTGAVTELVAPTGILMDAGVIEFTDVDLNDAHSVSAVVPATGALGMVMASVSTDTTGTGLGGEVTWSYTVPASAVEYLAAGEFLVETFTFNILDGNGGVVPQTVTVTVTGTNDAPIVTAGNITGTILEGAALLNDSGSISFIDVDLTDAPTGTEATQSVTALAQDGVTALTLTPDQQDAIEDAFSITNVGTNTNNGTVTWDYSILEADLDFLGEGEVVTAVFRITVADGQGGSDFEDVTVMITGSNDTPDVTAVDVMGTILEGTTLSDSGSISFTDVDLTDAPTGTEATQMVMALAQDGVTPLTLTTVQQAAIEGAFSITNAAGNTNNGVVTWDYSITEAELDFLAAGEVVTAIFRITVTDDEGATDFEDVTITLTGTNDVPVIDGSSGATGAVTETAEVAPADPMLNAANIMTTGTLAFSDLDDSDTFTASVDGVAVTGANSTDSAAGLANSPLLGLISILDSDIAANGIQVTEGSGLQWTFSSGEVLFDYLADGESVELTYTLSVTDNNGGVDTQDVVITVTGSNDEPIITSASPAAYTEGDSLDTSTIPPTATASDNVVIDLLADLTTVNEVDESDVISVTNISVANMTLATVIADIGNVAMGDITDTDIEALFVVDIADGTITFDRNHVLFDRLDDGEAITVNVTYNVNSTSVSGIVDTVPQTVTLTVNGSNDGPYFTAEPSDFTVNFSEGDAVTHLQDLNITFDDIELTDNHTATVIPVTGTDPVSGNVSPALADYIGTFSSGFPDIAFDGAEGRVTFQFTVADSVIDNLTEGEVITQLYQVTVADDDGDFVQRDIVVTITGTNDAPTITSVNFDGSLSNLVEDTNTVVTDAATTQSLTGDIQFDDVDVSSLNAATDAADTHTVTATVADAATDVTFSGVSTLPMGFDLDDLISFDTAAANASDAIGNTVPWSFDINDTDFDFLNDGEVLSITYTVTVTDDSGATSVTTDTATITVTVTGTNDAPTLTAGTAAAVEDAGPMLVLDLSSLGDDPDSEDDGSSLIYSIVTGSGANEGLASITVANPTDLTFDPGADFQDLGINDTRDVTIQIQATDANGALSSIQNVVITVTGTNDDPIIAVVTNPVAINEGAGDSSAQAISVIGNLTVDDVDHGDTLTGEVVGTATADLDGTDVSLDARVADLIANAALTFGAAATSDGTTQTLNYTYAVGAADLDFLAAGEVLTLSYAVQVDDGTTDSAPETVTITINGTNDVPVIAVVTDPAAITEGAGDSSAQAISVTGNLTVDDADHGDTLTGEVVGTATADLDGTDVSLDARVADLIANAALTFGAAATSDGMTQTLNYTYAVGAADLDFLAAGEVLTLSYTVQVDDGTTDSAAQTVTIIINGTNDVPVIEVVTNPAAINEGAGDSSAQAISVTGNLTVDDADHGDTLTGEVVGTATADLSGTDVSLDARVADLIANAALTFGAAATSDGTTQTLNYTYAVGAADLDFLAANEVLTLSYTVQVDDGTTDSAPQTVTIIINGTNDAPVIDVAGPHAILDTDAADMITDVIGTLTASDLDDSDTLTFAIGDGSTVGVTTLTSTYGTLTVDSVTGDYSFAVDNAAVDALDLGDNPTVTFDVQVSDGTATSTTTLDFNITGVNDAPIANDDATGVDEGALGTFNAVFGGSPGIVVDTDAEGHPLTIIGGGDVSDANSITTPQDITLGTSGSAVVTATTPGVFFTDWGAEVTLNSDGNIFYNLTGLTGAYQELGENDTAIDTFSYVISDGNGGTDTATVSVTITGQNDAPIAQDVTVLMVNEDDQSVIITPAFVDIDATDTHTFTVNTAGTLGTVTILSDGTFDYDPSGQFDALNVGDTATDSFGYTVIDSAGAASMQTVTITIDGANDAAVISGDVSGTSVEDAGVINGTLLAADVDNADNAFQPDVGSAVYGLYTVSQTGAWTYEVDDTNPLVDALNVGDSLTDTFTVLSEDGTSQTVTITIDGANDAAVISGDVSGTSVEDAGVVTTGTLLASDVDNADDTFQAASGTAAYGAYAVEADGEWTYTLDDTNAAVDALNVGDSLSDTFTVLSEDGTSQTVTITIDGANDAPAVVGPVVATGDEDAPIFAVDLLSGASDVDSATLSVVTASVTGIQPGMILAGSTLNIDPSDSFYQSLSAGETETYTINFDIIDGDGGVTSQTAEITIVGTNDVPVLGGVTTGDVVEDTTGLATGSLTITDADDGESSITEIPAGTSSVNGLGTFEVLQDGTWTFTLDSSNPAVQALEIGETTTDTITVFSFDGTASLELTVTITGAVNFITGTANADTIVGQSDEDDVRAGSGDDIVDAGDGEDLVRGQDGDDVLFGGGGDDVVLGGAGADRLSGDAGDDRLLGADGNDVLLGGDGEDTLTGDAGEDVLRGGDGNDNLSGGSDDDLLFGDAGNDRLLGRDGDDFLTGGDGDDVLFGDAGMDRLVGGEGDDFLRGGDDDDFLSGGAGNDELFGDAGADRLVGADGDDTLRGGDDDDSLAGGVGEDRLFGDDGDDSLRGDDGEDVLRGGAGDDALFGGADDDDLRGDAGNDRLLGGDGNDLLIGGDGDDTLFGDAGTDRLLGGEGNDILRGGDDADILGGGNGDDALFGDSGDDIIRGNDGNDTLSGGAGDDLLFGGSGDDTFVFNAGDGFDVITDFDDDGDDNIDLSSFGFSSFADIAAVMTQVGNHVEIDLGNGDVLRLGTTDISDIGADDFLF